MDEFRFDEVTRTLTAFISRRGFLRSTLGASGAIVLTRLGLTPAKAATCKALGRRCDRRADRCCGGARCKANRCRCPGNQRACRNRCIGRDQCCTNADCGGGICKGGRCDRSCPNGQKPCQGGCIPQNQCCGGCPAGFTCCTNVGACKDVRNDREFCGVCGNGRCPGGAICANGDCGLTCTGVGTPCFSGCTCGSRTDPAHANQNVCAGLGVFTCDTATTCTTDASCSPATAGFRQVCVSGLCSGKNVCADPCA